MATLCVRYTVMLRVEGWMDWPHSATVSLSAVTVDKPVQALSVLKLTL